MNTPVALMDFDGVYRFYGSRNQRRKHPDLPGHLKRASVHSEDGHWYDWDWSGELVHKTNMLKKEFPFDWYWLTSWTGETSLLERTLGLHVNGTDLTWNPLPERKLSTSAAEYDKSTYVSYESRVNSYRAKKKLEMVLDFVANHPDTPFMWVDDEAALLWTEEHSKAMTVPHLVFAPVSDLALSLTELAAMRSFLEKTYE